MKTAMLRTPGMRTAAAVAAVGVIGLPLGIYLIPDKWGYLLVGFCSAHLVLGALIGFREGART
jgi:hypothetical protein